MATPKRRAMDLLQLVAQAAEPIGLKVRPVRMEPRIGETHADAELEITHPTGTLELIAELKRNLTAENVGPAIAQLRRLPFPGILIADHINPQLAERLRAQNIFFLDAAGNAFLQGRGLHVWVTGRRNEIEVQKRQDRARAFQPAGLKLIFALLCRPDLLETNYRLLAQTAGVALGNIGWVLRDLVQGGFVRRTHTRRILIQPRELLDQWTLAYAQHLRPRLLMGRFTGPRMETGRWQEMPVTRYHALWGGEPAGALLTKYLKPGTFTLYAATAPPQLVVRERLKRDDNGLLEIRRKFWQFGQAIADHHATRPDVVPPVLVYADLVAIGEPRTIETAQRVFENHIDGPFHEYLTRATR